MKQCCSHVSLASCKIFSTISENCIAAFALIADYFHLAVCAFFTFIDKLQDTITGSVETDQEKKLPAGSGF